MIELILVLLMALLQHNKLSNIIFICKNLYVLLSFDMERSYGDYAVGVRYNSVSIIIVTSPNSLSNLVLVLFR